SRDGKISVSQRRFGHGIESSYDFLSEQFDRGPYRNSWVFFRRSREVLKRTEPRRVLHRIEFGQQFSVFWKILRDVKSDGEPVDLAGIFFGRKSADVIGLSAGLEIGILV